MPLVQLKIPSKSVEKSARMFTPKQITKETAWLSEARKVIPQIPDPKKTDWQITRTIVTMQSLVFELHNSLGDTASVVIDRTIPRMG